MKKKLLCAALAICLALTMLPFGALAADQPAAAPYESRLRMYLVDTQPGANGLYYDVDEDGVPELLIAHDFLDGSGGAQFFAVRDGEARGLVSVDFLFGDLQFSSDDYASINVVKNGDATQIMALKTKYYPADVIEPYGQTYWNMVEFWLYDYADGTAVQADHWAYSLLELEDGRYFPERSRILHNGSSASDEALDEVLGSIEFLLTVSLFEDTEGVPMEWLLAAAQGRFIDVPDDVYYAEPVYWAAENGITNGTSAYTFSPGAACTRAHVVTFLWRAAGEPEATQRDCPFEDIVPDTYFYEAVLWAVENGITTGTSATRFSPDAPCTRAQVVTFLHRFAGTPAPESTEDDNPFEDVYPGDYYMDAVLWASENGITTGVSPTQFVPMGTCARGQVVTFLCRAFAQSEQTAP